MMRPAAAFIPLMLLAAPAHAKPAGAISVQDAWSRPATPGLPGVAYLTLVNHGATEDRLTGAASPKAAAVTLHRSSMSRGVMTMTSLPEGLALPPRQTVRLAPNGYHLMLKGVRGGLKLAERYRLTLRFAHARAQTVEVEVRSGGVAATDAMKTR